MRPGLRLQILLLLGSLLLLGFIPLFFAFATYTRFTLQEVRMQSARSLGRAIVAHVAEARRHRNAEQLSDLLSAQIGSSGVDGLAVYDAAGNAIALVGPAEERGRLPQRVDPHREVVETMEGPKGEALIVIAPDDAGAVAALLRTDAASTRVAPLVELVGLYMGLIALSLLLLAYFALTRFIVRPLDAMSRAAERVAAGSRRLELKPAGARELVDLGQSLRSMTERLLDEEAALRKKVQEVEEATENLRAAQERLVRSERLASVGRLAAGLAHEIGNPISALIGMQDLLIEGGLDDETERDFLQRMRNETERINRILRDLLHFARPASPRNEEPVGPGNVEAAIRDTVTLLSPQKAMKDVAIEVRVAADLPPVTMSREHLVQVLLNLLLNAADACERSGTVAVEATATESSVLVAVQDTGPGILPDVREHLFEPFFTTKDVGKGTGLGLAVCRGLVEAAGGTIQLDADYVDGARFVVELPKAEE